MELYCDTGLVDLGVWVEIFQEKEAHNFSWASFYGTLWNLYGIYDGNYTLGFDQVVLSVLSVVLYPP